MTEITPKLLKQICKEKGMYSTPELNDKLYLHFKGIVQLKNLHEFTGLKSLWAESNGKVYPKFNILYSNLQN